MSLKNPIVTNGNRTRDLPACSTEPQPTAAPPTTGIMNTVHKLPQRPAFVVIPLPPLSCSHLCKSFPCLHSSIQQTLTLACRQATKALCIPASDWIDEPTTTVTLWPYFPLPLKFHFLSTPEAPLRLHLTFDNTETLYNFMCFSERDAVRRQFTLAHR